MKRSEIERALRAVMYSTDSYTVDPLTEATRILGLTPVEAPRDLADLQAEIDESPWWDEDEDEDCYPLDPEDQDVPLDNVDEAGVYVGSPAQKAYSNVRQHGPEYAMCVARAVQRGDNA